MPGTHLPASLAARVQEFDWALSPGSPTAHLPLKASDFKKNYTILILAGLVRELALLMVLIDASRVLGWEY